MITLVGATDAGGFQAAVTVNVPAGVEPGDRLMMFASANDERIITSLPEGWAVLREDLLDPSTDAHTWLFTRTWDEDDPTQVTVEWGGAHWHFLHIVALRGVDRIRTHDADTAGGVAQVQIPSLPAQAGDMLLAAGFHWGDTTKAFSPAGLTTITDMPRAFLTGYQQITAEGPTTVYTVTGGVVGLMSGTGVLLAPVPDPPPPVTFPLTILTELRIGQEWMDVSADVRDTEDVVIRRGRADEASTADSSSCTLTINNRHGRYSPRNPNSPYFGRLGRNTPIRVSLTVNGRTIRRFAGEVAEWPVRWDLSGNDVWVPITANGPLRRLNRSATPARSALRRFINAHQPITHWPLTDGTDSVNAAPDVGRFDMAILLTPPSGSLMVFRSRMDWQEGTLAPWLEQVARTRSDQGHISGRSSRDDVSNSWSVDMVRAGRGGRDRLVVLSRQEGDGDTQEWRLRFDHATHEVALFVRLVPEDAPPPTFTELGSVIEGRFFTDQVRHVRLQVRPDGTQAGWMVFIDGLQIMDGTTSGFQSPRQVHQVQYLWDLRESVAPDGGHAAIGHITVWDDGGVPTPPTAYDMTQAMYGYAGERAGSRIQRLAVEEGLALEGVGDLEDTPAMGPQQVEEPIEVMRDAERVDRGVLHESRDEVALVYRTGRSRYNQRGSG